jgi:hypothetical protein
MREQDQSDELLPKSPIFVDPARVAKLANVAVSEAVGVITLGVRVSPRAQMKKSLKVFSFKGF